MEKQNFLLLEEQQSVFGQQLKVLSSKLSVIRLAILKHFIPKIFLSFELFHADEKL